MVTSDGARCGQRVEENDAEVVRKEVGWGRAKLGREEGRKSGSAQEKSKKNKRKRKWKEDMGSASLILAKTGFLRFLFYFLFPLLSNSNFGLVIQINLSF